VGDEDHTENKKRKECFSAWLYSEVCLRKETSISMDADSVVVALKKSRRCHGYVVCPLRAPGTTLASKALNGHKPYLNNHADFFKSKLWHLNWWRWRKLYLERWTFVGGDLVGSFELCDTLKWRAFRVIATYRGRWRCAVCKAVVAHTAVTLAHVTHTAVASVYITHTAMAMR
jgi:Pyruvate/2-oxoacid:ferredoxin oxidoreductase delta subunit